MPDPIRPSMPTAFQKPSVSMAQIHSCPAPSPSISEVALGEVDASDYAVALCHEALRSARICAENIHKASLSIHANPLLSEGAKHVEADRVSFAASKKVLPIVDRASSNLATEIQRLKNKIAAPAVGTGIRDVNLEHEIRDALRSMTEGDRRKQISKSLEQGDDSVIAAVVGAPLMLSGLSAPELEGFVSMWRAKRFPDELARLARLEKVQAATLLAGTLLVGYPSRMAAPAIVAEAKRFAKTSADAIAAATGAH
jgi:hypothetical protein